MVVPSPATDNATRDNNNWTTVSYKKSGQEQVRKETDVSNFVKTKVTITFRVPKENAAFSAAEMHMATIKELIKQDNNLIALDHSGTTQVNIHKTFGHEQYKEWFQPREKKFTNGGGQISVAHYVLSELKSFNKTLMFSFLQKNKVFIYFNQREGLEHFSAIGVLFGPHPDYSWRQDTIDSLETTIKADLSNEEREKLTKDGKTQVVLQLTPQLINNNRYSKVSAVALEVRVPAEHERIYTEVLDRLNERASNLEEDEVDIILDTNIGTFFPYYAKNERPQLFEKLMRKQNSEMSSCSVIPLFGFTNNAQNTTVKDQNGNEMTVMKAILSHQNARKIEKTASSNELGKYLIIVDRYMKQEVEDHVDNIFALTPELEGQPGNFTKPQRGGNAFQKKRINKINNYLNKLEQQIENENLMYADDDEDTTPPPRPKKFTISYAQAAQKITRNNEWNNKIPTEQITTSNNNTTETSTLTQESLEVALNRFRQETHSTIESFKQNVRNEITSLEERITTTIQNALNKAPREITTVHENTDSVCTKDSQHTISTLVDKVDSLADTVSLLARSFATLQQEQQSQKRNRISASPTQTENEEVTMSTESPSPSPPSKQPRSRAPSPTLPLPPRGHLINKITNGAPEGK